MPGFVTHPSYHTPTTSLNLETGVFKSTIVFKDINETGPELTQFALLVFDGKDTGTQAFSFDLATGLIRAIDPSGEVTECEGLSGKVRENERVRINVPIACLDDHKGQMWAAGLVEDPEGGDLAYDETTKDKVAFDPNK